MKSVLQLLRKEPGKFVSGVHLSRALGVSRTAVWKRINQLRSQGYVVDSSHSEGYCLVSAPELPLPEEIRSGLEANRFARNIHYREKTDSTNRVASKLASEGADEGTLVVADAQTRGKGRLGRSWISPPRCNLYFSVVLRPVMAPAEIPQMTLMAAVSLCEPLREESGLPIQIKWPNDLWVHGKKVGGILTEMSSEMDRVNAVILGVGINVNMKARQFPEALSGKATSLSLEAGHSLNRIRLLQTILRALDRDYALFCDRKFKPFHKRWSAASMTTGRSVHVKTPSGEFTGRAMEISEQGNLRVRSEDGKVIDVVSGDVTVLTLDRPRHP